MFFSVAIEMGFFLESPVSRHLYHDLFDNTARDTHSCVGDQFPIMPEKTTQSHYLLYSLILCTSQSIFPYSVD